MFLDSESNIVGFSNYGEDDEWSNHPGWWKDFWSPKKAEAERYDSKVASLKKSYPINSDMECDDIDSSINKIDKALTKNANSGSKNRVITRDGRALENRRLDFKNEWDKADCTEQRLEEQSAEFETNIQKMFNQAQLKSAERKTEDKTLTYVAVGVGALVIGVVTYMSIKK